MTKAKNSRTLIKKCACGYVGRGDTFKKHRAVTEACRQKFDTRYYCHHHHAVRANGVKLADWHALHRDCPNDDVPVEALAALFPPTIAAVVAEEELDKAVLAIICPEEEEKVGSEETIGPEEKVGSEEVVGPEEETATSESEESTVDLDEIRPRPMKRMARLSSDSEEEEEEQAKGIRRQIENWSAPKRN